MTPDQLNYFVGGFLVGALTALLFCIFYDFVKGGKHD